MNARLSLQIVSMELRKTFAYRSDFWLSFVVSTLAQFIVAWFLWKSIFAYKQFVEIGGYSFSALMFYYLLVPILGRTVYGGNMGDVAAEIYQGSLTRYLVYPVSFLNYKLLVHCANASVLLVQLLGVTVLTALFFPGMISSYSVSPASILVGTVTIGLSTILYFIFSSTIQLIAFWADNVWSLSAILRFITSLLGGSLIPLSLFPDHLLPILKILPFACFINLPMQTLLGTITFHEWLSGIGVMVFWGVLSLAVYGVLWHRGSRHYTGVGI